MAPIFLIGYRFGVSTLENWHLIRSSAEGAHEGDGSDFGFLATGMGMTIRGRIGEVGETYGFLEFNIKPDAGTAVTTTKLREIPAAELLKEFVRQVDFFTVAAKVGPPPEPPVRGRGPSDEHLRYVSEIYNLYRAHGQPTMTNVERIMQITKQTAQRWVAAARDAGYIEG